MSTCFCGCLEEIGFFERERRRANESGAELNQALADLKQYAQPWISAGRPGFEALPDTGEFPSAEEELSELLTRGSALRDACLATLHQIPGSDTPPRKEIKTWLGHADFMIVAARMPLDARTRWIDALMNGSPEEVADAYDSGKAAI